jgi:hypothetical protein
MQFDAALVKEQGVTFAVVSVKQQGTQVGQRDEVQMGAQQLFPGVPIVLMSQDARGVPQYYGRRDIVNFLAQVPFEALPWRSYSAN